MASRHVLYHACWARAWRCQEMSESTLVCITLEERCTGSHGIRLALARRDGSARARTQMCTRQAKQRAGHQAMTASRGRRCARSALMRPTTHRVKVEETSDIGSPREPTDENDLILSLALRWQMWLSQIDLLSSKQTPFSRKRVKKASAADLTQGVRRSSPGSPARAHQPGLDGGDRRVARSRR